MAAYNFLQVTEIASYDIFVVFNSLLLETDSLPVCVCVGGGHNMMEGRWRGQVQREGNIKPTPPCVKTLPV